jgi:hypothetical protein
MPTLQIKTHEVIEMDILGYASTFLLGGFLTALLFVVGYSNKIAKIETVQGLHTKKLDQIETDLRTHMAMVTPVCHAHEALSETVAVLKSFVTNNRDK